ncbi:MAG TPA: sugar phosphate isomerase/epimerase, partial [Clostridiales bacterium]|nr:sugar phosphate isomerase/epimerase [Clostridiales bacterium]
VHAKDFAPAVTDGFLTRGGRRIRGTVIGEGMIPIAPCLGALVHAGYDGYITVEYEGTEDALTSIARGKANLEALLARVKN